MDISQKLLRLHLFTSIFVQTFPIRNITIGLYQAARECGHFQAPMPKTRKGPTHNHVKDQHRPLSVPPPKDEYLEEA